MKARELWEKISYAAWACADPGIQFHTTINDWHTCPKGGDIRASNPCSEYMFLDDTACNLASLNLMAFRKDAAEGPKAFRRPCIRACGAAMGPSCSRSRSYDGRNSHPRRSPCSPSTTARWAWATPISAGS